MRSKMIFIASLVVSSVAIAHPGHDHSTISNPLLHSILTAAFIACGALAVYFYKRAKQNDNNK